MAIGLETLTVDAAAGGLFGLVGTAFGRIAGFFERKQTHKQERARWTHELALERLTATNDARSEAARLKQTETEGSWTGLARSLEADAAIGPTSLWVSNTLRLVRPLLTLLLWMITGLIFLQTQNGAVVEAAVFAATAATLWWFGDRAPRQGMTIGRAP